MIDFRVKRDKGELFGITDMAKKFEVSSLSLVPQNKQIIKSLCSFFLLMVENCFIV